MDKADRFWPYVTRLVVAILILFLILMYLASQTVMGGPRLADAVLVWLVAGHGRMSV